MTEKPQGPADETQRIVGSFDITLNLSDKRGIKVTGYIYDKDDAKALNERLDWFQDALDRQGVRTDIVNKRAQIAYHRVNIEAMSNAAEGLLNLKNAGRKLSSQQQQQLNAYEPNVAAAKMQIESLEAAIIKGEEMLATT
jgi:hypothetical protein